MAYGTRPHAQLQRTASDVPADEIDLLATPTFAHVHTPTIIARASTKVSQRVTEAIARNTVQHNASQTGLGPVNGVSPCLSVTACLSVAPTPLIQVSRGLVAEAIARHATVVFEHSRVERDRCSATARLLMRAGWNEKAEAIMAAAPACHPQHRTVPLCQSTEGVISLRSVAVLGVAFNALAPDQENVVGAWKGSLVAASSMRPPLAGSSGTPTWGVHSARQQ